MILGKILQSFNFPTGFKPLELACSLLGYENDKGTVACITDRRYRHKGENVVTVLAELRAGFTGFTVFLRNFGGFTVFGTS